MMLARASCVLILLMVLPAVGAAPVANVPTQVFGADLVLRVDDLHADTTKVTYTIGTGSNVQTFVDEGTLSTSSFRVFSFTSAGMRDWTIQVESAAEPANLAGQVYVADSLAGLRSQVAGLAASVSSISATVTSNTAQTTTLEADLAALATNVTSLQAALDGLNVSTLLLAQREEPVLTTASNSASPIATAGVTTSVLLAIGILVVVVVTQWQAARRHQEQMVIVLAMAARMNVGPDSPEFQIALAAFQD